MSKWVGTNLTYDWTKMPFDPKRRFKIFVSSDSHEDGERAEVQLTGIRDLWTIHAMYGGWPLIISFNDDKDYDQIDVYDYWME